VDRDAIAQAAQARAEQVVNQARAEGDRIRQDADEYVLETLRRLEIEMERLLTQVRNGVQSLQSEKVPEPASKE
jgi:cell division septum initiation protein DivIVA